MASIIYFSCVFMDNFLLIVSECVRDVSMDVVQQEINKTLKTARIVTLHIIQLSFALQITVNSIRKHTLFNSV